MTENAVEREPSQGLPERLDWEEAKFDLLHVGQNTIRRRIKWGVGLAIGTFTLLIALAIFLMNWAEVYSMYRLHKKIQVGLPALELGVALDPLRRASSAYILSTESEPSEGHSLDLPADAWRRADISAMADMSKRFKDRLVTNPLSGASRTAIRPADVLLQEVAGAIKTGNWSLARLRSGQAARYVASVDFDAEVAHYADYASTLNSILLTNALFEDVPLSQKHAELRDFLANAFVGAGTRIEDVIEELESEDPLVAAWRNFMQGKLALSERQFGAAIRHFASVQSPNKRLTDLALLGEARARFWQARARRARPAIEQAVGNLIRIESRIEQHSFKSDLRRYISELKGGAGNG